MNRRPALDFSTLGVAVLLALGGHAQQRLSGHPCTRPVAFFAGKTNGEAICSPEARAAYGVIVKCWNVEGVRDTTIRLEVRSFRLVVVQMSHISGGVYRRVSRRANGGLLTDRMKEAVLHATIGDSLLIRDILVRTGDGRTLKSSDLRFALSGDRRE